MGIFLQYGNSTARWIEISRRYLNEATCHNHTLLYQHLHHARQSRTRGGSHRGDIQRQYRYGTRTANTLVRQFFFCFKENYREEAAAEIANWTIKHGVEDYFDKSFATFVWNVIERGKYEDLMEPQRLYEFFTSAWAKAATPSLDQIVSPRKLIDSNVQVKGVDGERGAWERYHLEKLKKRENECGRRLSRTKARLERENESYLGEFAHKLSAVMDDVRAEIRQTSSKAPEAIAHLAEDTIGSITSTVTCNGRPELPYIVRENLPANEGRR